MGIIGWRTDRHRDVREWVQTPKWHPAYWCGLDCRRLIYDEIAPYPHDQEGWWEYSTARAVARRKLEAEFG